MILEEKGGAFLSTSIMIIEKVGYHHRLSVVDLLRLNNFLSFLSPVSQNARLDLR